MKCNLRSKVVLLGAAISIGCASFAADTASSRQQTSVTQPDARQEVALNAAVFYWQAFATLPPQEFPENGDPEITAAWIEEAHRALELLHKASATEMCNWQLDYSKGFELELPHLAKMRTLSRVAIARARMTMQEDPEQAHADLQAVMRAARHLGIDPLLIVQIVRARMEENACAVLKDNLTTMPERFRNSWTELLASRPASPTLAEIIDTERRMSLEFLRRKLAAADANERSGLLTTFGIDADISSAELDRKLDQAEADYREVVRIAGLPDAERTLAFDAFEKQLQSRNDQQTLSQTLIPAIIRTSKIMRQAEAAIRALAIPPQEIPPNR